MFAARRPKPLGVASREEARRSRGFRNELLYTGRRIDPETGLQLNRHRFYHQQLGGWVSRDPIGQLGRHHIFTSDVLQSYDPFTEYAEGPNLYEYVSGRSVSHVDHSGLQGHPSVRHPAQKPERYRNPYSTCLAKRDLASCKACCRDTTNGSAVRACENSCNAQFWPRDRNTLDHQAYWEYFWPFDGGDEAFCWGNEVQGCAIIAAALSGGTATGLRCSISATDRVNVAKAAGAEAINATCSQAEATALAREIIARETMMNAQRSRAATEAAAGNYEISRYWLELAEMHEEAIAILREKLAACGW